MSRQITKAEYWGQTIQDGFFGDYRELIAHFGGVTEGITSFLQLNFADELIAFSKKPDPRLYRRLLTEALVTLIDRGALTQIAGDLNDLAEAELANLRRETGIGVEMLPPPPPKPLSAQEQLDQRVSNDWNVLKVATFKKNCANDKAYRETFERLSAENRLGENTATSLVRAGA
jgi:hypothetical protein